MHELSFLKRSPPSAVGRRTECLCLPSPNASSARRLRAHHHLDGGALAREDATSVRPGQIPAYNSLTRWVRDHAVLTAGALIWTGTWGCRLKLVPHDAGPGSSCVRCRHLDVRYCLATRESPFHSLVVEHAEATTRGSTPQVASDCWYAHS